jgi:hypothetical protein
MQSSDEAVAELARVERALSPDSLLANSSTDSSLIVSSARGTPKRQAVRIVPYESLSRERRKMFDELLAFFNEDLLRNEVIPIILLKSTISLRLLDWLVTNYAKRYPDRCTYRLPGRCFKMTLRQKIQLQHIRWVQGSPVECA